MRGKTIIQKMTSIVEHPSELLPGKPLLELLDGKNVFIENHSGVIGYDTQCVNIKIPNGAIEVWGNDLTLKHMSRCQLCIRGQIDRINWVRRG